MIIDGFNIIERTFNALQRSSLGVVSSILVSTMRRSCYYSPEGSILRSILNLNEKSSTVSTTVFLPTGRNEGIKKARSASDQPGFGGG
jgi:hypothetical protein